MNLIRIVVLVVSSLAWLSACSETPAPSTALAPDGIYALPAVLREVSGVAVTDTGSVLLHDDELAYVYELDIARGDIDQVLQIGEPVLGGDYEGIALLGETLYLISSGGKLLIVDDWQRDPVRADYREQKTGLKKVCEVEGLSPDQVRGTLAVMCKNMHKKKAKDAVDLYRYNPADDSLNRIWKLAHADVGEKLRPSGISLHDGDYLLVAAANRLLLRVSATGEIVHAVRLSSRHPQAEGIGVSGDALVIADEGGKGSGLLTHYPISLAEPVRAADP